MIEKSCYLGTLDEFLLSSRDLLGFSTPSAEDGCLECASVAEGQSPWFLAREFIDRVKVYRSFLLGLASAEEGDTGDRRRYRAAKCCDGSSGDFHGRSFLRAALSGRDHVRLEKSTLEIDMVVSERLSTDRAHK